MRFYLLLILIFNLFTHIVEGSRIVNPSETQVSNNFLNSLSEPERAWLRSHPVISVVQDPAWPPVEFTDEHGKPSGMASDYLSLVENRLGMKFKQVKTSSWQAAYARLKSWDIDMTTSVAETPERSQFWTFTKPYMKIPIVIVTKPDVTFIAKMDELDGKRVAVVDGYAVNDWIPRDYPNIRLVRVKSVQEGLDRLGNDNVFAYIDNLLVVGYYQTKMKASSIKIAGETPYVNAQSMAVRKDWPIFAGILQKALDSISETERDDIYRKWLPIRYEHGYNYMLMWYILSACILIFLIMIIWNRKMAKEIIHRKIIETELKDSEQRFRRLFDAAVVPFCLINKNDVLTDCNSHMLQFFGYALDEIPTLDKWWSVTCPDPDYRRWVSETWDSAISNALKNHTDIGPLEYELTCKNGDIHTVIITGTYIGDSLLCAFFDITERKKAEEALRKSEILLNETQIITKAGGWEYDIEANKLTWTDEAYDIHGVSRDFDLQNADQATEFYINGDRQIISEAFQNAVENGVPYDLELQLISARGEKLWVRTIGKVESRDGKIVRVFGNIVDITERKKIEEALKDGLDKVESSRKTLLSVIKTQKKTEEALRESERRLIETQKMAKLGHWIWDISTGDVEWSIEVYDIFKQDPKYFKPHIDSILALSPWSEDQVHGNDLIRKAQLSHDIGEYDQRILRPDGSIGYYHSTYQGRYNDSGDLVSIVGTAQDITERKLAEDEKMRLESQLQQAQKMELVGRLAGGIAHDFNNILTGISGLTDIVLKGVPDNSAIHEDLTEVLGLTDRASGLTRQLLAFSRHQSLDPIPSNLNTLISNTLKMLKRLIGENIELDVSLADDLGVANVDASRIEQVLINLAVNARDAMPDGGNLSIKTCNIILDDQYVDEHIDIRPGAYIQLMVTDNGSGINPETQQHIFEPFFTTKEIGKGTGLGLATVYGIVKQHGGTIWFYSEKGIGTTFKIYLPRIDTDVEKQVDSSTNQIANITGETILLVEDESSVRRISERILKLSGYNVLSAANAADAENVIARFDNTIQLLLTDVVMPGISGPELYKKIKIKYPDIIVVFMSGYSDLTVMNIDIDVDKIMLIQKPFTADLLVHTIQQAFESE